MRKNPDKRLGSSEHDAEDVKKQGFFKVSYRAEGDDVFLTVFNKAKSYFWSSHGGTTLAVVVDYVELIAR